MEEQKLFDDLSRIIPIRLRHIIFRGINCFESLIEIRFRVNKPIIIIYNNKEYFINEEGELVSDIREAVIFTSCDVKELLEYVSCYSLYAFEDEIRQGFITIVGGHRVGITGKTIIDNGKVKSMNHISCVNIRVSHQIKGCSDKVLPYIFSDDNQREILHTLIISPPRCGKTTLLRDLIRQISNGNNLRPGMTVGVVDERSEIGACYLGIAQNDLGIRTDILDCCPKSEGMMMLIRAMAPQVIAIDEIGTREDIEAVEYVINCGCKLIATVHGNNIEEVKNKPLLGNLIRNKVFDRYIIMNNKKRIADIEAIFDARGSVLSM